MGPRKAVKGVGHRFDPRHVARLLDEQRRNLLPPDEILAPLDVHPQHVVADVGCGPGYFSLPLAERCRTVYGVDVSPDMLDMLRRRAGEAGTLNIEPIQAVAEQIPLPDASVDRLLCAFVLHEVDSLALALREFRRLLKPAGKLMIIEWDKQPMEMGPPLAERLHVDDLVRVAEEVAFQVEWRRLNPYHYVVLAQR
ncbi:MAG: methyltransferase domain-containing protein [Alicyclobacillus sp.]|nr:methyltransferase domain-containing protein [Alicyclobacillus sp.]